MNLWSDRVPTNDLSSLESLHASRHLIHVYLPMTGLQHSQIPQNMFLNYETAIIVVIYQHLELAVPPTFTMARAVLLGELLMNQLSESLHRGQRQRVPGSIALAKHDCCSHDCDKVKSMTLTSLPGQEKRLFNSISRKMGLHHQTFACQTQLTVSDCRSLLDCLSS
jgi:hypothetical protein